jgi:hypothetical protein
VSASAALVHGDRRNRRAQRRAEKCPHRRERQPRLVAENDQCGLRIGGQRADPSLERGAQPVRSVLVSDATSTPPVDGAFDRLSVRTEDDDRARDRRLGQGVDDVLKERSSLETGKQLPSAETARCTGGQDHRIGA